MIPRNGWILAAATNSARFARVRTCRCAGPSTRTQGPTWKGESARAGEGINDPSDRVAITYISQLWRNCSCSVSRPQGSHDTVSLIPFVRAATPWGPAAPSFPLSLAEGATEDRREAGPIHELVRYFRR